MESSPTHNNCDDGSSPSQQNYPDDDAWSEDWDDSSTVASTVIPVSYGLFHLYAWFFNQCC